LRKGLTHLPRNSASKASTPTFKLCWMVSSNWACTIAGTFRNPRIVAVTGPMIPLFNNSSIAQIPKAFHWLFGCSTWADYSDGEIIRNVWGANMAFKRTALKNVGGFSDQIGGVFGLRLHGEENELSMRLGNVGHVVFLKDMCVLHKVTHERIGTRFVLRSSYWMGFTRYVLNKNYGKLHPLSPELNVMRSVLIDGVIASILNLLRSRQNFVTVLRVSTLVIVSAIAGYVAAMVKEAFADNLDSHIWACDGEYFVRNIEFNPRVRRKTGKKLYHLLNTKKSNKAHVYSLFNGLIITRSSWIGYSRRNIAKMARNRQLTMENSLLVSMLRSLVLENCNQSKLTDGPKRTKVSILA
jgi:hypothetical protein